MAKKIPFNVVFASGKQTLGIFERLTANRLICFPKFVYLFFSFYVFFAFLIIFLVETGFD